MTDDVVAFKEKVIIFCALLAGLPLAHLDVELLGFRRFVWLGASILGLISLLSSSVDDTSSVDSISFALLSTALVPHVIQLIKDQSWLGVGVLPPFFIATYQSTQTVMDKDSEEYWQVRWYVQLNVLLRVCPVGAFFLAFCACFSPPRTCYLYVSFLHLFAFTLPYLNHLPSGPPPPTEEMLGDEKEDGPNRKEEEEADKSTTSKSDKKQNLQAKRIDRG